MAHNGQLKMIIIFKYQVEFLLNNGVDPKIFLNPKDTLLKLKPSEKEKSLTKLVNIYNHYFLPMVKQILRDPKNREDVKLVLEYHVPSDY